MKAGVWYMQKPVRLILLRDYFAFFKITCSPFNPPAVVELRSGGNNHRRHCKTNESNDHRPSHEYS